MGSTSSLNKGILSSSWFLPYLWGIETLIKMMAEIWGLLVFTLPMRNWNVNYRYPVHDPAHVFTLPMRNWNLFHGSHEASPFKFLPYLWGIETINVYAWLLRKYGCFYPTYEELKLALLTHSGKSSLSVFTLPMRNWNYLSRKNRLRRSNRFYPTYEELKLWMWIKRKSQAWYVFTLPMRNWNIYVFLVGYFRIFVFTLPMRNWNYADVIAATELPPVFTLPMRNWKKTGIGC